jgi:hypothetical protein
LTAVAVAFAKAPENKLGTWAVSSRCQIFATQTHTHTYIHALHCIAWHYITLHYIFITYSLHYVHYITLHYITSHHITLHYITSRHIMSHHITLHYNTLQYITLHSLTLHYIIKLYNNNDNISYVYIMFKYISWSSPIRNGRGRGTKTHQWNHSLSIQATSSLTAGDPNPPLTSLDPRPRPRSTQNLMIFRSTMEACCCLRLSENTHGWPALSLLLFVKPQSLRYGQALDTALGRSIVRWLPVGYDSREFTSIDSKKSWVLNGWCPSMD